MMQNYDGTQKLAGGGCNEKISTRKLATSCRPGRFAVVLIVRTWVERETYTSLYLGICQKRGISPCCMANRGELQKTNNMTRPSLRRTFQFRYYYDSRNTLPPTSTSIELCFERVKKRVPAIRRNTLKRKLCLERYHLLLVPSFVVGIVALASNKDSSCNIITGKS